MSDTTPTPPSAAANPQPIEPPFGIESEVDDATFLFRSESDADQYALTADETLIDGIEDH